MTRAGAFKAFVGVSAVLLVSIFMAIVITDRRLAGLVHAVATGLVPPELGDPGMIRRGAVHYDLVCAACHASPVDPQRGASLILSPPAATLHDRVGGWPPSLLFKVVRDGVAGSAMPAWPAQDRADEIWAVVAFLAVLPDLSADDYAALAGLDRPPTDGAPGTALAQTCGRCHGAPDAAAPRLDIQQTDYMSDALRAYRSGARESGFMQHLATRLQDDDIRRLADWLAQQNAEYDSEDRESVPTDSTPEIAKRGAPERQIAACNSCHDPSSPVRRAFPVLAGQHAGYLATQLTLFADDAPHGAVTRGGGPFVSLMQHAAKGLTEDEIAALSAWFATQP